MNLDHGLYTETEKKLAFVNDDDGPYITRLKVQSWRGTADYNYWTGQPGPHMRQPAARSRRPAKPQMTREEVQALLAAPMPVQQQQRLEPAEAVGVAIFWIGLIWFLCWLFG